MLSMFEKTNEEMSLVQNHCTVCYYATNATGSNGQEYKTLILQRPDFLNFWLVCNLVCDLHSVLHCNPSQNRGGRFCEVSDVL